MQFAWGSVLTLTNRVGGALLWMIAGIILARALPVRDLGIYVATIVVAQGIGAVVASYASATGYFVSNKKRDPSEVAAHGLLLGGITGSGFFLASLVAWAVIGEGAVLIVGAALLPIVTRHALAGVFLGQNRLLLYNVGVHIQALATTMLLVAWLLLPIDRTAGTALVVWLGAQYLSAAFLLPWAPGAWRWIPDHGIDWPLVKSIVTFGGVMGLASAVSYFNYRVDQLLVSGLDSAAAAGVYSRAVMLAEGLWLLSTSLAVASYATIGGASHAEAGRLTARAVRHTIFLVAAGAVAVAILAPFLLETLFGSRFTPADTSLRILCIGTALFAPQALLSNYFTIQLGKPWLPMSVALSSCLINIVLSTLLIPEFGFVGGAWATTVSYGIAGMLSVTAFLKMSGVRPSELWRPRRDDIAVYARSARSVLDRIGNSQPPAGDSR